MKIRGKIILVRTVAIVAMLSMTVSCFNFPGCSAIRTLFFFYLFFGFNIVCQEYVNDMPAWPKHTEPAALRWSLARGIEAFICVMPLRVNLPTTLQRPDFAGVAAFVFVLIKILVLIRWTICWIHLEQLPTV